MLMSLGNMVIQLSEGTMLAFRDAGGVYLECNEGIVWLTVEGHPCDIVLAKGERQGIESNGLAILQGLPSASVKLVRRMSRPIHQESRSSTDQNFIERRVRNEKHGRNIIHRMIDVFMHMLEPVNPESGNSTRRYSTRNYQNFQGQLRN